MRKTDHKSVLVTNQPSRFLNRPHDPLCGFLHSASYEDVDKMSLGGTMDYMDGNEHKRGLSSKHLETLSNRVEKVALLLLASLVIQKIFAGEGNDPSVIIWFGVSLALYYLSYHLLVKS